MLEPRTLKGFPDYLPDEQSARQFFFTQIKHTFEHFGFQPMSTPVLEYKELLTGKYGDDEKLMYTFTDHGGREVAMRYDQTVPLARFYSQHKDKLSIPFKRYSIAPVWRADNTQKGRLREFYQCDVDVIGSTSTLVDSEVLACYATAFRSVCDLKLRIHLSHRGLYSTLLLQEFALDEQSLGLVLRAVDKFDKQGASGVREYLKASLASEEALKAADVMLMLGTGSSALDFLENNYPALSDVVLEVRQIIQNAETLGVPSGVLVFDPLIVRGLDYYTGMVFEPRLPDYPEYGSVGGGGRYDNLLGIFGGVSVPAVGFGMGIDRLFEVLSDQGYLKPISAISVVIFNLDDNLKTTYLEILQSLRSNNIGASLYYSPHKLDKQFRYAEKVQSKYVLILGAAEAEAGTVKLKELSSRTEFILSVQELVDFIKKV